MSNDEQAPNLAAILDWVERRRPDMLHQFREIIASERRSPGQGNAAAMMLLMTVGFQAGRQYQIDHPEQGDHSYHTDHPSLHRYPVRTGDELTGDEPPLTPEQIRETVVQLASAADAYASGMLDLSIEKERGFIRERLAEAVLASHEQLHTIFGLLRRL